MAVRERTKTKDEVPTGPTVPVEVGALAGQADAAMRVAADKAAREDLPEQVGFLLEHIGGQTTAAALGLSDKRQLTKWWRDKSAPKAPATVQRLHLLFQVAYAITAAVSGAGARRFLLAGNPHLGDEAPLMLIRGDVADARVPVLGAVRLFLE